MKKLQQPVDSGTANLDRLTQRCLTYLRCWPVSELRRLELVSETIRDLGAHIHDNQAAGYARVIQELRRKISLEVAADNLTAVPGLQRRGMPAASLTSFYRKCREERDASENVTAADNTPAARDRWHRHWQRRAMARRLLLALLVFIPALLAAWGMSTVLPYHGSTLIEKGLVALTGILFAWVSVGFWVAMFGSLTLLKGKNSDLVGLDADDSAIRIASDCRVAVLFPICGEDMRRVSAGIFAVYQSLRKTGRIDSFDFYLLSDSSHPDSWVNEEVFWRQLSADLGDPGNIYYRRRRLNLKRKSGNIADFCRRFGAAYRYLVVFDADSVMSGKTLVKMVHVMERNPHVGILQTPPAVAGKETLLARVQQFCSRAYGPVFAAGLNWIQQGDGSFWGHNAILRTDPFMRYCGLPRLSGKAPWGGDILSHDFVESALMRRAGWSVWLAYDFDGSYEEAPPTLLDELKRDRRWCSGNLQHLRLLLASGFRPAHRWLFVNGVLSYVSAPLWCLLLALSSLAVVKSAFSPPDYFPDGRSLFPQWPVWDPYAPLVLMVITATLLFLPKLLACLVVNRQGRAGEFGGRLPLFASVLVEMVLSACLAPIRMVFHSRFVLMTILRRTSGWNPQNRDAAATSWREAWGAFYPCMLLALGWGGVIWLINRSFLLWLTPVLVPLLLSVPLAVFTSRRTVGLLAKNRKLLLIPEETAPPSELVTLGNKLRDLGMATTPLRLLPTDGFVRAVLNPQINLLHRRLGGRMTRSRIPASKRFLLMRKALNGGPEGLSVQEKKRILQDNLLLWMLHKWIWALPEGETARKWFGRYTHRSI